VLVGGTTEAVLDDLEGAPIDEKLRATLRFLRKVTLSPDEVTPADADLVRAAGVSDAAIEEALYVAFLFNLYNRLADTLGFAVPDARGFAISAKFLLTIAYR
jgi:alkylhydroperoxidase family enzyme